MNLLRVWINLHCWQFAGLGWAVFCLLLIMIEILPRVSSLVGTYKAWQINEAQFLSLDDWGAQNLQLTRQKEALQTKVEALYISIPRNDQMSVILDCLQESSQGIALSLLQIKTDPSVSKDTHMEQPLGVIARGTFHALGTFIDRIERSPFLIKVKSLKIERAGKLDEHLLAELALHAIVVER